MRKVIIMGAGKIGRAIAKHLSHSGDYLITMIDKSQAALAHLKDLQNTTLTQADPKSIDEMVALFNGDCVISACSFDINKMIAEAALKVGCSYFDLTEDVETTDAVETVAANAKSGQIFMPQCGLAPGFIGILAHSLSKQFDELEQVKLRVGALPLHPSNMMKYNLTWSTEGLINEYCNPCHAIVNGESVEVMPLEGLEVFSLDGIDYEAFNTSGGLGPLHETLAGRVKRLDYKTVRYQGHCHLMRFLMRDLKMGNRAGMLKEIFEEAVPITKQDVVLIFVSISGKKNGEYQQITNARKIYHQTLYGEEWSSIQITTASGICAVVDLFFEGKLPSKGYVKQEEVNVEDLLNNRFGRYFVPKA